MCSKAKSLLILDSMLQFYSCFLLKLDLVTDQSSGGSLCQNRDVK